MELDTHALAWAAGFFDGEGCVYVTTKSIGGVHISQADPAVLERFRASVGGLGKVYGPYSKPGARPQWKYAAYGFERAQAVMALLWPWLDVVKREQAARVLPQLKIMPRGSWRRFCLRKHDTQLTGRSDRGECRACIRERDSAAKRARRAKAAAR